MKITLTKRDVIWSYIGIIMSMASNLLLLPFIIYYLDDDMFGLWGIFLSIGAVATLFDCGFSVTFARNITYCWSGAVRLKSEDVEFVKNREPDFRLMKKVLMTCKLVYLIVAIVALVVLLLVGTAYVTYVTRTISGWDHMVAWLIYVLATVLNLYYGYYASFLRGVGNVEDVNKNTVIARTVQILVTIVLLMSGFGIIGACTAYFVYGIVFRILGKYKFFQYQDIGKKIALIAEKPSHQEIKELFIVVWHNAWKDGVISICNYFSNQASTLICSMYLSLAETGVYSLGVQIASAIAQIAGALYTTYQPTLQEAYINQNKDKIKRCMSIIVMSFIYLFALGTAGVIVVGVPLIKIIKPSLYIEIPTLLGLCVYQFMLKLRNCYTSYFSCTNRINYLRAFVIASTFCVALSFIFVGYYKLNVNGLIAAQIISQGIYNVWYWPKLAHHEMQLGYIEMFQTGTNKLWDIIKSGKLLK